MSTAYALRAEFEGTHTVFDTEADEQAGNGRDVPRFLGGVVRVDDDRDVNVAEALEAGGGVIVVDDTDTALITALDGFPALKHVTAPEGAEEVDPYEGKTVAELRDELAGRALDTSGKRDELVARLRNNDQAIAVGDQAAADHPDTTPPEA